MLSSASSHWRAIATRSFARPYRRPSNRRWLRVENEHAARRPSSSRHAQFYSDLVPAMIPVALLGSAVYVGLHLLQTYLSHEKYLDEARARIEELEREIDALLPERGKKTEPGAIATKDPEHAAGSWLRWLKRG
ncbi:hypothetical protein F5148DRAFT_1179273 [Russula earlei]|uniref:Uncharacterized protein n=1 Tax=Russula earlei TaxID=71964 RepID=A0ACC0UFB3_9AGAM|nr:hypothetical protein F5148DRAFT_1179273 [Russula earlei]